MATWSVSSKRGPRWGLSRTTAPLVDVLDREEFKRHARILHDADDVYLDRLLPAVQDIGERELGRSLVTQTWTLVFDSGFPPADVIEFPMPPLIAVTTVNYVDINDVTQTFAASNYSVRAGDRGYLKLNQDVNWPDVSSDEPLAAATFVFTAGYGASPEAVPEGIRATLWLLAGHFYEHREPVVAGTIMTEVPMSYRRMLWNHRETVF